MSGCCISRTNGAPNTGSSGAPEVVLDYTTSDATPVVNTIGTVPTDGDYLMVPRLDVHGATFTGVVGNVLQAGYEVQNTPTGTVLRTMFSLAQAYGAGTLTIAVALAGDALQVTTTGLVGTDVHWTVNWVSLLRTF